MSMDYQPLYNKSFSNDLPKDILDDDDITTQTRSTTQDIKASRGERGFMGLGAIKTGRVTPLLGAYWANLDLIIPCIGYTLSVLNKEQDYGLSTA